MPNSNEKSPRSDDLVALESAISPLGISIFNFETLLNKSWSLIVRKEELLVRFFWDGRDNFMLVEETDYVSSNRRYLWHPTLVPKVEIDESRESFRYIEEVLKKKFQPQISIN